MMYKKRGQITTFIVVGIIVLFVVGFVLFVASEQQLGLRIFREEETEIHQFMGLCLEDISKQAIFYVGLTGGYVNVPEEMKLDEKSYFSFAPKAEPKIPLWYYKGVPRFPKKELMEEVISNYTLENIDACLENFDVFRDKFDITVTGDVTVETKITDTAVLLELNYPLEVKEKATGIISKVTSVARAHNVKLGRMYDMAVDILREEARQLFFENFTIDLLAARDDFPFTGMDFGCNPKTWKKSELIGIAKDMIYYNVQQVTVQGNRFRLFDNSDVYARNNFIMPMENTYPDIGVTFFYPRQARFELHVRPNDREILRSNTGRSQSSILRLFCITMYHFTYDIEYPLLVTLKDERAFDTEGFIFNFAFPVTINHNEGDKTDFSTTVFESPSLGNEFCTDKADTVVDIRVVNKYTFEELHNADVEYKCVRLLCEIGTTTADLGIYRLRESLPAGCTNGLLIARKEGYLDGGAVYEGGNSIDIPIKPLKNFKVKILVHDSTDFSRVEELQIGDEVMIAIKGVTEPDVEQYFIGSSDFDEIQLVDGAETYRIEAMIIQDEERIVGGYIGDWAVAYSEIIDKTGLTFHLVKYLPLAVTEAQQQAAAEYLFSSADYQLALRPTFS